MLPVTESCYNCTLNNVSHTPQRLAINSTGLNYSEASASFAINTELEIKVYLGISHHRRFCQAQWRPVQCTVGVPVSTGWTQANLHCCVSKSWLTFTKIESSEGSRLTKLPRKWLPLLEWAFYSDGVFLTDGLEHNVDCWLAPPAE